MKVEYVWRLEVSLKKVDGGKVFLRARTKQMHDEWGSWTEQDVPGWLTEGQTLDLSFPFTIDIPSGGKLT